MLPRSTKSQFLPCLVGGLRCWLALGLGCTLLSAVLSAAISAAEAPSDHARALSLAFRKAAHDVKPAVVTVVSHYKQDITETDAERDPRRNREDSPLPEFPREGELDERGLPTNVGSGVIFDRAGLVLTNAHVVRNADEVVVRLADGNEFTATDIRTDPASDLAVLTIKSDDKLPFARLGDSSKLDVGDWVIAIGSPFELEATVSAGIISAKGRSIGHIERGRLLQTDATINPGNSGGPLVNLDGEVIGINTAIATNTGVFAGVGFAVPVNQAKWVSKELLEHNRVRRSWLGVRIGELTAEAAREFKVEARAGVWLVQVVPGGPADKAGLRADDIILEFSGVRVRSQGELQEVVEQIPIGTEQPVLIQRKGDKQTLKVSVEALPEATTGRRNRRGTPPRRPSTPSEPDAPQPEQEKKKAPSDKPEND